MPLAHQERLQAPATSALLSAHLPSWFILDTQVALFLNSTLRLHPIERSHLLSLNIFKSLPLLPGSHAFSPASFTHKPIWTDSCLSAHRPVHGLHVLHRDDSFGTHKPYKALTFGIHSAAAAGRGSPSLFQPCSICCGSANHVPRRGGRTGCSHHSLRIPTQTALFFPIIYESMPSSR